MWMQEEQRIAKDEQMKIGNFLNVIYSLYAMVWCNMECIIKKGRKKNGLR